MDVTNLVPLHNMLIIRVTMIDQTTPSGIIISNAGKIMSPWGIVDRVGDDVKISVDEDDKVLFNTHKCIKITDAPEEYVLVSDKDIFCIDEN